MVIYFGGGLRDTFMCFFIIRIPEVKIKREHVQGSADSDYVKPEIEPITEDTVRRMENPGKVEICKSSGSSKKD
jgi:hypothetical protein